jgi:hypothetical protein
VFRFARTLSKKGGKEENVNKQKRGGRKGHKEKENTITELFFVSEIQQHFLPRDILANTVNFWIHRKVSARVNLV